MIKLNINKMRSSVPFLFFALFIVACSLNSEQEARLNESTNRFLTARKNGAVLMYVSMCHPEVIRHFKEQSDSSFMKKFDLLPKNYELNDASIETIEKDRGEIHVLYQCKEVESAFGSTSEGGFRFVAMSSDDGQHWLYVEYEDYVDKSIAPKMKRLIEVK
jgi:hypothetical protein